MTEIIGWTTTLNFTDVSQLPRLSVDGTVVEFRGHHVIPQSVFTSDFFVALKQNGLFDGNSFKSNGISLPSTLEGAEVIGSAYHAGAHQAYTDWIEARVASFN